MYYAVILSINGRYFCVKKTAHYSLAMQTFLLIEKHSPVALDFIQSATRFMAIQKGNISPQLSLSDDREFISEIPVWDHAAKMMDKIRKAEFEPETDIIIDGDYITEGAM